VIETTFPEERVADSVRDELAIEPVSKFGLQSQLGDLIDDMKYYDQIFFLGNLLSSLKFKLP